MKLQDYFDISNAPDLATFDRLLLAFAHHLEFGIISGSLVIEQPSSRPLFIPVGKTPEAFLAAHMSLSNSFRDPVLARLKHLSLPFTYDQRLYVEEGAADLWDLQAPFGYHSGIAMALHLPGGKHFLLGVDRDHALPADEHRLTRMMADLQLLAVHAQHGASRLLTPPTAIPALPPDGAPPTIHLTPRECEVLKWTMEGKSSWVIGRILNLSERTVNFHVRNAARKLNASSKHQAVVKALSAGLI